ncbi:hypothetical protein [Terrarubrum flagellatum]|uniref:hypothetical protein n=1 Tax=Terrirubrum flagellatum TaxID=2895980 RepID=UPI00314522C8
MSDIPYDIVPQILIKIQEDIASFRRDVTDRFNGVDSRLDRLEAIQKQERRNTAAMLVMMRERRASAKSGSTRWKSTGL